MCLHQLPLTTRTVPGVPHCRTQGGCSRLGQLLVLHPAEGTKFGWAGAWLPTAVAFTAPWRTWDDGSGEVPRVPCSAMGLGDSYPAGTRCEWDQSQVGAEGKLGVLSLCQLCCCHQHLKGLSSHQHLCHGGDLPEPQHSLLQSLPQISGGHWGVWRGRKPCSWAGAGAC